MSSHTNLRHAIGASVIDLVQDGVCASGDKAIILDGCDAESVSIAQ